MFSTIVEQGVHYMLNVNLIRSSGTKPSSLNTLGYSPVSFEDYCSIISDILSQDSKQCHLKKPVIFSVTGSPQEIQLYYRRLCQLQTTTHTRLLMEINLSCPNILGKEPPAYSHDSLILYLQALRQTIDENVKASVEVGIKLPPYTHKSQYDTLISALLSVTPCPLRFITSTNTLGSCLYLSDDLSPAINSETGTGIGGLAGDALHPLALGNVRTIRSMLDLQPSLKDISIIGVGGVSDGASFSRMRAVGADAIAVGTALGRQGVEVFSKITREASELGERKYEPKMNSLRASKL